MSWILKPGQFSFTWGKKLGEGGLGRVDEIIVTASNHAHPVGTHLACKRLSDKWKNEPTARERFEREIIALRGMSHHAIVTCEGESLAGSSERFYVMPLYKRSLREALAAAAHGFEWTWTAQFVSRIADAMAYAHGQGFIHRDLKPENILLDSNHNPVVADWGVGYFVHKHSKVLQQLTRGGMGTEYYCSMEQWSSGKCTQTGDVYSLGLMLAELIHGSQLPITLGMGIQQDVVANKSRGARMLNELIKTMTDLLPQKRVQTMAEVAQRLRAAAAFAIYAA